MTAVATNFDDHDARLNDLERQVRAAIVRAYEHASDRIDIGALAEAIAADDEAGIIVALNLDEGLQTDIDQQLGIELIPLLIGALVASMHGFANRYGSRIELASHIPQLRTEIRRNVIEPLARRAYETLLSSIREMRANDINPRLIAERTRALITLSPDQARSTIRLRRALDQAMNHRNAVVRNGLTMIPGAVAAEILRRNSAGLNAAQRSMLLKTLNTGMSSDIIETLDRRHRTALGDYRMRVIAQQEATRVVHAGEYLAFRQGKANRSLPKEAKRFWITTQDERVRHNHRSVPTMNAEGVDVGEPFSTPVGPVLYPPMEVNCRCRVIVKWPGKAE